MLTEYVILADIGIHAQHVAGKFLPSEVVVALRGCEWKHGIVKFLSFGIFNYVRVLAYLVKRFAKCALGAGYGDVEYFKCGILHFFECQIVCDRPFGPLRDD
jgi:hypothetical protein